jgi:hypothetical protein
MQIYVKGRYSNDHSSDLELKKRKKVFCGEEYNEKKEKSEYLSPRRAAYRFLSPYKIAGKRLNFLGSCGPEKSKYTTCFAR